jgi:hypothetical protein
MADVASKQQRTVLYTQPLKMELRKGSETSENYKLTPGKYPKEQIQYSKHGESLKSRRTALFLSTIVTRTRRHTELTKN